MKVNEIETLLGLSRANIRFYEKEGLLSPTRNENGYREYTDEDIAVLKRIIIFRKLGLSLPQIKDILDGNLELSVALEENITELSQKIEELNGALEVSQTLKNDGATNDNFDEEHYWNLIQSKENAGEKFADVLKDYIEIQKHASRRRKTCKHPMLISALKWIGGLTYFISCLFFIPIIAEDIDYYTLSEAFGTLTFTVVMKDGRKTDCIGGEAMMWTSNLPEDKYPASEYDFVRYLTRTYTDMGIELRVNDWDKLYKQLDYESWIDLAKDIRKIAGK